MIIIKTQLQVMEKEAKEYGRRVLTGHSPSSCPIQEKGYIYGSRPRYGGAHLDGERSMAPPEDGKGKKKVLMDPISLLNFKPSAQLYPLIHGPQIQQF